MDKLELILSIIGTLLIVVDFFILGNIEKENKRLLIENQKLKKIIENKGV